MKEAWDDYPNYSWVVEALARKFIKSIKRYGVFSFEDLLSEGRVIFYHTKKHYKADMAQFSTYFFTAVKNRYLDILNEERYKVPLDEYHIITSRKYVFDEKMIRELHRAVDMNLRNDWRELKRIKKLTENYSI